MRVEQGSRIYQTEKEIELHGGSKKCNHSPESLNRLRMLPISTRDPSNQKYLARIVKSEFVCWNTKTKKDGYYL